MAPLSEEAVGTLGPRLQESHHLVRFQRSAQHGIHYEDEEELPYPVEELVPGPRMLRLIVAELAKQGFTFVLPLHDEDSMEALALPLRRLVSIGQ